MPVEISPSFLTADLTRLGDEVGAAMLAGAERLHVDVMDGRFVPNLTFGPLVVAALKPLTEAAGALMEVHLMIDQPENLIPEFAQAGAQLIIVHVETSLHLNRTIQQIRMANSITQGDQTTHGVPQNHARQVWTASPGQAKDCVNILVIIIKRINVNTPTFMSIRTQTMPA